MSNFTNNSRNASYRNENLFDILILIGVCITMFITSIMIAVSNRLDKRPLLPLTTHDTCHATGVSKSPTSGNVIRRTNSRDDIVIEL
jgi:hypothetical protein